MKKYFSAAGPLCGLFLLISTFLSSAEALSVSADLPDPGRIPVRFDGIIEKACVLYEVDPVLIKAMLLQESRFNPRARGKVGEIGLMQIRQSVAKDWAKAHAARVPETEELFDPYLNIMIGVWRMHCALEHWKGHENRLALALFEYNAGRTRLLTWIAHCNGDTSAALRRGPSAEYVRSVRKFAAALRSGAFSSDRVLLSLN